MFAPVRRSVVDVALGAHPSIRTPSWLWLAIDIHDCVHVHTIHTMFPMDDSQRFWFKRTLRSAQRQSS